MENLKPCPFCGSEAEYFQGNYKQGHGDATDSVGIRCTNNNCHTKIEIRDYADRKVGKRRKQALTEWNSRS